MKSKRSKINSVMSQLDFRVIKDSMVKLGMAWKDADGCEYVPSVTDIEAKARQMLEAAANSPSNYYKSVSGNMMVRKSNVGLEFGVFVEYRWD